MQRHPRDVGVDLHHERVPDQPAGDHQLARRQPGGRERVEDHARAEGGRLHQRAVDVLRAGGERQADEDAAELVVDEHGAVAVEPVEREQPVRADLLRRGELREPLVFVAGQVGRLAGDEHEHLSELAERAGGRRARALALDWNNGNRSVLVDHELSGLIVGLTLATRPEDVYRALIEATAFGTRMILERSRTRACRCSELSSPAG